MPSAPVLKNFDQLKVINQNSFFSTYQAYHKIIQRNVLLHQIPFIKPYSQEMLLRFNEIQLIMEQQEKPGGLKLLEQLNDLNNHWFIYDFFSPTPLEHNFNHLSLLEKIKVLYATTQALTPLHQQKITHNVLHPGFIFISRQDNYETRISGFGLKNLFQYHDLLKLPEKPIFFHYISPESTGILKRPVDKRSDIYSLGMIFYEFFSGHTPFQSDGASQLIYQHLATKPAPLAQILPSCPPALSKIISKMIEKEPENRYHNTIGLLYDLEKLLKEPERDFEPAAFNPSDKIQFQISLTGRSNETALLHQLSQEARTSSQSLLITGKSGSGKTKLVESFLEQLDPDHFHLVKIPCSQAEKHIPYFHLKKSINNLLDALSPLQVKQLVFPPALQQTANFLLSGLNQAFYDHKSLSAPPLNTQNILAFLSHLFSFAPLQKKTPFFFLDDIQWMDPDSLSALALCSSELSTLPSLFVFAYRVQNKKSNLPSFFNPFPRVNIHTLSLSPLDYQETRQFVQKVLNMQAALSNNEYQILYEQTQGAPFGIMEWLSNLLDKNLLYCDHHGKWKLQPNALHSMPLLPSQEKFLLQRLDIFTPEEKYILALASVVGKGFTLPFLEELLQAETTHPDALNTNLIRLIRVMDKARKHQILRLEQQDNDPLYHFVHSQLSENLYEYLKKKGQTANFHQLYAQILEQKFQDKDSDLLFEITYHYNHTGNKNKQLHFNYLAYKKATQDFSLKQAAFFLEKYLLLQSSDKEIPPTLFPYFFQLIDLLQLTGQFKTSFFYIKKIKKLALEKKDSNLLQEIYHKLGVYYYYQNENKKARENFSRELEHAQSAPSSKQTKLELAYFSLASAYFFESNYKKALPLFNKALEYVDQDSTPLEYLRILGMRSWVFLLQGEFEEVRQAVEYIENYLVTHSPPEDLLMLSVLYHLISYYYSYSERQPEKALSHALKSYELASRTSYTLFQFSSLCSQLKAYIALKKYDHAIEIGRKAVSMAERDHISISLHLVYAFLIEAYLATEQYKEAANIARKGLVHPQKIYPKSTILDFYLALAMEAYAETNYFKAENLIRRAYRFYLQHNAPFTGLIIHYFYYKISLKKHPLRAFHLQKKLESNLNLKPHLHYQAKKARFLIDRLFSLPDKEKSSAPQSVELQFKDSLQLDHVIKTSQLIASILDIDRLLPAIIQKTLEVTGAQTGCLLLFNAEEKVEEKIYYPHSFTIPFSLDFILKKISDEPKGFLYPQEIETHLLKQDFSYLVSPLSFENKLKGVLILETGLISKLFENTDLDLLKVFTSQAAISLVNAQKNKIIQKQFSDSIQIITSLIANTSSRLYDYTQKVTDLSVKIARKSGLTDSAVEEIRVAALVHDLGLLSYPAIAEKLLVNKQALTSEEESLLKTHPQKSIDIISSLYNIDFIKTIILQHHEHYDGSGYPAGLKKNQISLGARILKLSDDFINCLYSRYYQGTDKISKLEEFLKTHAGSIYDPGLIGFLLEFLHEPSFFNDAQETSIDFKSDVDSCSWSFPSNIHYEPLLVSQVMDKIAPFIHDSELSFSLEYSLAEVLRNAIVHGNNYDESKKVIIALFTRYLPDKVVLSVTDEGAGMNIVQHQHFSKGRNELFDLIQDFKELSEKLQLQNQTPLKNLTKRLQHFQLAYYSDFNIYRQFHGKELTGGLGLIYVQKVFDKVTFQHQIEEGNILGTTVHLEKLL